MLEKVVVVAGMPRSGTSWLGQIIDSCPDVRFKLCPLFSYAFKNAVNENSTSQEYADLFEAVYLRADAFMDQTERRQAGKYPIFELKNAEPAVLAIKMTRYHHLLSVMLERSPKLKMVLIVRHPCGAINSWLKTRGEFPANADPMKEWRTGSCRKTAVGEYWGFNDWIHVTKLHLRLHEQNPERVRIQQYEQLVTNPVEQTKEIFAHLGLEFTNQTLNFLSSSQRRHDSDSYAVYKDSSVKDAWHSELDEQIRREILDEIEGSELERFL